VKKLFALLGMAILGGVITLGGYKVFFDEQVFIEKKVQNPSEILQTNYSPIYNATNAPEMSTDFTVAAENTVHAVVHVKNTAVKTQTNPWAERFYGSGNGSKKYEQVGTGSGVIISSDGHIVTNNHVIEDATEIEITLNNRKKIHRSVNW
jgi:serine protease Do